MANRFLWGRIERVYHLGANHEGDRTYERVPHPSVLGVRVLTFLLDEWNVVENKVTSEGVVTYTFDGLGRRVPGALGSGF